MPRRDRRNQQRPERPNRHRDPSVLNEQAAPQAPAAVEAPAVNEKQVRVELVDAPRKEVMPTAMLVNIDEAKSEIVALNDTAPVAKPAVEVTAPADAPVEAPAAEEFLAEVTASAPAEKRLKLSHHQNSVPAMTHVNVVATVVLHKANRRKLSN